jgi:hypothetical protein
LSIPSDDRDFWNRVEHELQVKQPGSWRLTLILLRAGMATVLFSSIYVLFFYILRPAKGYFFSAIEMTLPPVFWVMAGTLMIICGAYLRFRAMGPIVDKLKVQGLD